MKNKPNKQIIIDFIIEKLRLGIQRGAILAKVVEKWHISSRTFDRLHQKAKEQLTDAQQVIKQELARVDIEAAVESRKKAIMSADERKEYLSKIIIGEIEVPYTEVKWDKNSESFVYINLVELPGPSARIAAINELNKMEGDHAPMKVAPTDPEGNAIKEVILRVPEEYKHLVFPSNTEGNE